MINPKSKPIGQRFYERKKREEQQRVLAESLVDEMAPPEEGNIIRPKPTIDQVQRGEYHKPVKQFAGLSVSVENEAGTMRRGVAPDGKQWASKMYYDYGELGGSIGADGDAVDVFLGPDEFSKKVFVVHQNKYDDWNTFDEDKVMLGFGNEKEASDAFLKNYDDKRFLGPVTTMTLDEFKSKVYHNVGPEPLTDEATKKKLLDK